MKCIYLTVSGKSDLTVSGKYSHCCRSRKAAFYSQIFSIFRIILALLRHHCGSVETWSSGIVDRSLYYRDSMF